jgi:signal transduction histidine kinase
MLNTLNYAEQSLDLLPDLLVRQLPVNDVALFYRSPEKKEFKSYFSKRLINKKLNPVNEKSHLVVHLKNSKEMIILSREKTAKINIFKKSNPDLFEMLNVDVVIPLLSLGNLSGFVVMSIHKKILKEIHLVSHFFNILSHILIPQITYERTRIDDSRNYYRIYRMDRLALVGELAASAAHEIKNPLAGISTYIKYFTEKKNLSPKAFMDELMIMKQSIQRIDHIIKSLLSFSKHEKKKISKIELPDLIERTIQSIALKIPKSIKLIKKLDPPLTVKTDAQRLQQVLINILFNAADAIGKKEGQIHISTYISGRDQLPENELFNISIRDTGPGIPKAFKEKLFQPFQTTKEEGTGLGLYTCYGLMKSLGGDITINSSSRGTDVVLSLAYSFDEEDEI